MDEPAQRPARGQRRGHDVHQTHFFYADDLASGATVRDHVTGQVVGEVTTEGRHVFEGYGASAPGDGAPGDLVVEVKVLEDVPGPAATAPIRRTAPPDPAPVADGEPETGDEPEERDRAALGASVAQGVAIAVLAPLLALALLAVVLVLLIG